LPQFLQFPEATVLFGDIAGFTSWSSAREPSQVSTFLFPFTGLSFWHADVDFSVLSKKVFILLETIYGAFDVIADNLGVFKVETIGDCCKFSPTLFLSQPSGIPIILTVSFPKDVAATGLPEPMPNHATTMAKFAAACRSKLDLLARELESTLGPDTCDLQMRFGLHSGPVTGGVLRGQKSRFQLFGDTVNTAARMESTGLAGRIHVSQATADCLVEGGKSRWITKRDTLVEAKGKGLLQTYWIDPKGGGGGSIVSSVSDRHVERLSHGQADRMSHGSVDDKTMRLVKWNTDLLSGLLRRVVASRDTSERQEGETCSTTLSSTMIAGGVVLDELQDILQLTKADGVSSARSKTEAESVKLTTIVRGQLHDFVLAISSRYSDNLFHNFQHASHVAMSVTKLLSRVVTPPSNDAKESQIQQTNTKPASWSQDCSYCWQLSDPLVQFACVFSALIHDVGHSGVPNAQLAQEDPEMATRYRNQSIAEQHSIDIAWSMLMEPCYADLCRSIFTSDDECRQFRRLVVNSVLATDIFDKELGPLRTARWQKAFPVIKYEKKMAGDMVEADSESNNRKATMVIEHVLQASDVSHTMQHWHSYLNWNEKLFQEQYRAYQTGRSINDPSEGWYSGELWFFDCHVIPLAKKLNDCGALGTSSGEYLTYAEQNREEWERKGLEIVKSFVKRVENGV
jgi:class 3 adenylate cyclase